MWMQMAFVTMSMTALVRTMKVIYECGCGDIPADD